MKEILIEYQTSSNYPNLIKQGHYELNILPCHSEVQEAKMIHLKHNLKGGYFFSRNKYNFETLHIRSDNPFQAFNFNFKTKVRKKSPDFLIQSFKSLEEELDYIQSNDFFIEFASFLLHTPLTRLSEQDIPQRLLRKTPENIGTYVNRLNEELYNLIKYQKGITEVSTTAKDVLKQSAGVCQDFSHVMIGILRHQQIAARYVSGYLNNQETSVHTHLHAWVEAYIPFVGWKGFDPTNQLMEDEHYIKIAHGKDYLDCQTIKGILKTQEDNGDLQFKNHVDRIKINLTMINQQQ